MPVLAWPNYGQHKVQFGKGALIKPLAFSLVFLYNLTPVSGYRAEISALRGKFVFQRLQSDVARNRNKSPTLPIRPAATRYGRERKVIIVRQVLLKILAPKPRRKTSWRE